MNEESEEVDIQGDKNIKFQLSHQDFSRQLHHPCTGAFAVIKKRVGSLLPSSREISHHGSNDWTGFSHWLPASAHVISTCDDCR